MMEKYNTFAETEVPPGFFIFRAVLRIPENHYPKRFYQCL